MFERLLLCLVTLNVFDCFITLYGLNNDYITELNPIMNALYQLHPTIFITTKLGLSVLLLFLAVRTIPKTKLLNGLALTASILYMFIFAMHGYWLTQIFIK